MKKKNSYNYPALGMALTLLFSSCASATLIQSNPSGAKVYLNKELVGTTPYRHEDTRIVGSKTHLDLVKEGYYPLSTTFSRDEEPEIGALVGGVFVLFPYLWAMKYKPNRSYELKPLETGENNPPEGTIKIKESSTKSMAERLRELKDLQDEGIITQQEFEMEKRKVLEDY